MSHQILQSLLDKQQREEELGLTEQAPLILDPLEVLVVVIVVVVLIFASDFPDLEDEEEEDYLRWHY